MKAFVSVRMWVELRDLFDGVDADMQAMALLDRLEGKPLDYGGIVLHQIGVVEVVQGDDATTLDDAMVEQVLGKPVSPEASSGPSSNLVALVRKRMRNVSGQENPIGLSGRSNPSGA